MFKEDVWNVIKEYLIDALISAICRDRDGDAIDREMLRTVIQSYKDLGLKTSGESKVMTVLRDGRLNWEGKKDNAIYNEYFEIPFLKATEKDYQMKALIAVDT